MTRALRVLVVDDAETTLEVLRRQLESAGHDVRCERDVPSALRALDSWAAELVLTDLRMPGPSGLDLVRHLRQRRPDAAVVMITGYPSLSTAVEAGRTGVDDFLSKPFTETELHQAIGRALDARRRRTGGDGAETVPGLVARAAAMRPVVASIREAAASLDPVLVIGPPGSGRRHAVHCIHDLSQRAAGPVVWMDAARVPPDRIEAELFGARGRPGLFEAAGDGTLVVAGIEHLPEIVQIRMLTALRERRAPIPGGGRSRTVDVRLAATVGADLDEAVRKGVVRGDLAQRLGGHKVRLPALRERAEDIPELARGFAARASGVSGGGGPSISDDALERLSAFEWPGNVAELGAVMVMAVDASGGGPIEARHLPPPLRYSASGEGDWEQSLDEVERRHVVRVLERCEGNKSRAARVLGIDRRTLRDRVRRWGLEDDDRMPE
jgi:DNA-binding NtrC family response regulator